MIYGKYVGALLASATMFASTIAVVSVNAQEAAPPPAETTQAPAADAGTGVPAPGAGTVETQVEIDDSELDAFVEAYVEVNSIGQSYAGELQAAATPEEQMEIQTKASDEMMAAIGQIEGMDAERYNEILRVSQIDTALAQKINERLQQVAAQ